MEQPPCSSLGCVGWFLIYTVTFKLHLINLLIKNKKDLKFVISCLVGYILVALTGIVSNGSIMSSNPGLVKYGSSDELVESSVAEVEAHNQVGKL